MSIQKKTLVSLKNLAGESEIVFRKNAIKLYKISGRKLDGFMLQNISILD